MGGASIVTALAVDHLVVRFGGLDVIDDLSFSVRAGERLVIFGPNGAGKTTLFNVITGQLHPTAGRVSLFGQDITAVSVARRVDLGLGRTFQIATLFPRLTVLESAMLAVQAGAPHRFVMHRAVHSYAGTRRRALELLEAWDLAPRADIETRRLAYGEQRRIELVLALARRPRLLLLDEPAAGLSAEETAAVVAMIREMPRDVTIMLIEHDVDMALQLADRVLVLQHGRLLADGDPTSIRHDPQVAEVYFGAGRG
ncbi:MAG: ABC transporter ATP-binding protein [Rhodocyclaceae bacterium]|nr:ABC transporter ATP-binding protein [Rhodocyclaceae bacterium]